MIFIFMRQRNDLVSTYLNLHFNCLAHFMSPSNSRVRWADARALFWRLSRSCKKSAKESGLKESLSFFYRLFSGCQMFTAQLNQYKLISKHGQTQREGERMSQREQGKRERQTIEPHSANDYEAISVALKTAITNDSYGDDASRGGGCAASQRRRA